MLNMLQFGGPKSRVLEAVFDPKFGITRQFQVFSSHDHGAARQGEGDLTVAPGRNVPRPSSHTMSGALQECVKQ